MCWLFSSAPWKWVCFHGVGLGFAALGWTLKAIIAPSIQLSKNCTFLRSARNLGTLFWLLLLNAPAFFRVSAQMMERAVLSCSQAVGQSCEREESVCGASGAAAPAADVVASERDGGCWSVGAEVRTPQTGTISSPGFQGRNGGALRSHLLSNLPRMLSSFHSFSRFRCRDDGVRWNIPL